MPLQILAFVCLTVAALLSALLLPNQMNVIPLVVVSGARAVALAGALFFWAASGRLDGWGVSSRFMLSLLLLGGVAAVAGGCLFIQIVRNDDMPAPAAWAYRIAAGLLPVCLVVAALLPSRTLFLMVASIAPVAGVVAFAAWKPLSARYYASLPKSQEQRESEALLALEKVPETAGVATLVEFARPEEPDEVRQKALQRIEKVPDWMTQAASLLEGGDGKQRLEALYVLSRRAGQLPAGIAERCWTAAAAASSNGEPADRRMLVDAVLELGRASEAERERHLSTLIAVRGSEPDGGTLDLWIGQAQLRRIPEDGHIENLLRFAGPGEAWVVRQEALARLTKASPDSTAKLLLIAEQRDGVHRLDALVVLGERAGQLSGDQVERCWRETVQAAAKMRGDLSRGEAPARGEVAKLIAVVSPLWVRLGPEQQRRAADLKVVRDVVRAAGDPLDQAAFAWADRP